MINPKPTPKTFNPCLDFRVGDLVRCNGCGPGDKCYTGLTGLFIGYTQTHYYADVHFYPEGDIYPCLVHPESLEVIR